MNFNIMMDFFSTTNDPKGVLWYMANMVHFGQCNLDII